MTVYSAVPSVPWLWPHLCLLFALVPHSLTTCFRSRCPRGGGGRVNSVHRRRLQLVLLACVCLPPGHMLPGGFDSSSISPESVSVTHPWLHRHATLRLRTPSNRGDARYFGGRGGLPLGSSPPLPRSSQLSGTTKRGCRPWARRHWAPRNMNRSFFAPVVEC